MKKRAWPSRMTLLAAALAVLLVVLAIVQYRWVGQVSDAEREQLRASLHQRGQEFAIELNRELARAFATFQTTPLNEKQEVGAQLAAAWLEWTRQSRYPRLLRAVYFIEAPFGPSSVGRLSRLDAPRGRLEPVEWPPELAPLRGRFSQESQIAREEDGLSTMVRRHTPLDDEVPALLVPAIRIRSKGETLAPLRLQATLASTIVPIDVDYLQRELLPALTQRYFNPAGASPDFTVAIVRTRRPHEVIFRSDAKDLHDDVDVRQPLLELRADEMGRVLVEQTRRVGPDDAKHTAQFRVTFGVQQKPADTAAATPSRTGVWQLLVTHRAGSVDAAIRAARTRNLTVSFGILLLFGASIALLVVSTERARRLADRQMEFVAAVSHELRTPLAVIRSAGENLADGVVADPSQVERYGRLIEEQGRSLSDMVEQVLAFAGAESGPQVAERRPVDIGELLGDVIEATEQLTGRSLTFERSIDRDLPRMEGDRDALRRVFQNLVDNAVKYSGDSRWIGIGASVSGHELRISVTDRGMGIEASELRHIFEPFYRGRRASSAQIHGSGLGLSLVQRIVQAHGGTVSVKSAPGHGSTFTVVLPAAPASSVNETSVAQTCNEASPPTDEFPRRARLRD